MNTPTKSAASVAAVVCGGLLLVLAGCMSSKTTEVQDGLRPSGVAGAQDKSLYEMAVSNEAARLRKANPDLSMKDALATARGNVSSNDFPDTESPEEQKARKLKEARKAFAADLEKTLKQ